MTKRPLIPRWLGLTISAPIWLPFLIVVCLVVVVLKVLLFEMRCITALLSDWSIRRRVAYAVSALRFW